MEVFKKWYYLVMPIPVYSIRIPTKQRKLISFMAKLYGSPTDAAFIKTMLMMMCSGNILDARDFMDRIFRKLAEYKEGLEGSQMPLNLSKPSKRRKVAKKKK